MSSREPDEGLRFGDRLNAGGPIPRRITAVESVLHSLRAAILRGDLPGQYRLVQTEIAEQLGVSTTPVREAMRELASEGLIALDSHRVGTVRTPDWNEMHEIVEMRRALEPLAIERAMAGISVDDLEVARALAQQLANEEDVGTWVQINLRFHTVFHEATNTVRLRTMLVSLEEAGCMYVAQAQRLKPATRRRAIADHFALLDAFEAKDPERAVEIQLEHLYLPLATHDESDS